MNDEIINKPKFNLNEFFNKNKKKINCNCITVVFIIFI